MPGPEELQRCPYKQAASKRQCILTADHTHPRDDEHFRVHLGVNARGHRRAFREERRKTDEFGNPPEFYESLPWMKESND